MDSVLKISELLYKSSLEATQSIGELLQSTRKAKVACSIFREACLLHENWLDLQSEQHSCPSSVLDEKESSVQKLVSISTPLKEDGTFHCRLIDNYTYNEKLLHDISNKLWWVIKDSAAKCVQPVPLNCPIFHFSSTYNMFVRGVVVSCQESQQNKYLVCYLDFGCTLKVNAETQFFLLPNEFQNQLKYPYQSLHCTLFDTSIKVPAVVEQKFLELTTNRVLKIYIKCTVTLSGATCLLVELRTIPENLIINHEITKIVNEEASKRKEEIVQKEKEEIVQEEKEIKPLASQLNSDVPILNPLNLKNGEQNNDESVHGQINVVLEIQNDSLNFSAENLKDNKVNKTILSEQSISNSSHSTISNKNSNSFQDLKNVSVEKKETISVSVVSSTAASSDVNKHVDSNTNKKTTEENQVNLKLVPLQNLLYNAKTPRTDSWTEIELLNISKLLQSQAQIQFFIYSVSLDRIMSSLKTKQIHLRRNIFNRVKKGTSVYIILKVQDQGFKNLYVGIAKPNFNRKSHSPNDRYDVVYLSLSCVPMINLNHNVDNFLSISLMEAKAVILQYEACLKKKTIFPLFNHIYPWCEDVFTEKVQNGILSEQSLNTKTQSYENVCLKKENSLRRNSKPVIDQKLFRRCLKENVEFNDSIGHNGLPIGLNDLIGHNGLPVGLPNQANFDSFCGSVIADDKIIINECNGDFIPRAILQRPTTVGYYDPYGTWFPEIPIVSMYINPNVIDVLDESIKANIQNGLISDHNWEVVEDIKIVSHGNILNNVQNASCGNIPNNVENSSCGNIPNNVKNSSCGNIPNNVQNSSCGNIPNNVQNSSCGNIQNNVEKELEKLLSSPDEKH